MTHMVSVENLLSSLVLKNLRQLLLLSFVLMFFVLLVQNVSLIVFTTSCHVTCHLEALQQQGRLRHGWLPDVP